MHRMFPKPRWLGWSSLFAALALLSGTYAVSAQSPLQLAPPGVQQAQHVELAVGMTRACQMTTRADLKRVENPNSRVVRVERIADKNNEVLLVAEAPGRTLITLVDQNDRAEIHEIIVQAGGGDTVKATKLKLNKGAQETRKLDAAPLGGVAITKADVADVVIVKDDPTSRTVVFRGLAVGTTRITFLSAKKDVIATYDVEVVTTDRAAQLRALIAKLAPTASVTVTETSIPRKRPNQEQRAKPEDAVELDEAVVLSGTANDAAEARLIVDAAQRLFPPSDLGQGAVPVGGGVAQQSQLQGNVINNIRIGGVHTVSLEVVVAVVNRSEARNMSFSWAMNGSSWFTGSVFSALGFNNTIAPGIAASASTINPVGSNVPFGVMNNSGSFMSFMQALRTEGLGKVYAEPRLTTLSGRPGQVVSGGEAPIVLPGTAGSPPSITYKPFGAVVNCLPIVMGNGKIHLEVTSELSDKSDALSVTFPGGTAPGFITRRAQVTVQIEDGQTLAIGGLIKNTVNATISRVPFLGDIPFLGTLFSSKSFKEDEEELIILVTPRLVDAVDCSKIPRYLPGRETRSPDDFELFLEGIMEAPRGQRNVIFHPHYYKGAHTLAPNAGQIPCGDGSCNRRAGASCVKGDCGPTSHIAVSPPQTLSVDLPSIASPMPTFPDMPTRPSALPPARVETEAPATLPSVSIPMSSRQLESRPLLPPIGR